MPPLGQTATPMLPSCTPAPWLWAAAQHTRRYCTPTARRHMRRRAPLQMRWQTVAAHGRWTRPITKLAPGSHVGADARSNLFYVLSFSVPHQVIVVTVLCFLLSDARSVCAWMLSASCCDN